MTTSFAELALIEPLLRAVADEGYRQPDADPGSRRSRTCSPAAISVGCAQTGTGKTAAFALPILQRLAATLRTPARRPARSRVLVLTPTRELAAQIGESFATYGQHLCAPPHGDLRRRRPEPAGAGARARASTSWSPRPGRLLDLTSQRLVHLHALEIFVLDEADRMLDMGFIHDVRSVIALLPRRKRQTLFFSATMPPEAQKLGRRSLHDPAQRRGDAGRVHRRHGRAVASTSSRRAHKRALLDAPAAAIRAITRALVFTRTKHGANRVAEHLDKRGIGADAIHGNKSQNARERALARFKRGESRVLVATDIAARGIDIDGISHVINFDLPNVPETYVHRIGRTARAGASGRRDLVLRRRGARVPARHRAADHAPPAGGRRPGRPRRRLGPRRSVGSQGPMGAPGARID